MSESIEKLRPSGPQIRAARDLLQITQRELADAAGIDVNTLSAMERSTYPAFESTIEKVQSALERRGIEFLNHGRPGVRFHPDRADIPT